MPFAFTRTIRLADTDAAGVVYFASTLSLCHEAYEEALAEAGVPLRELLDDADLLVPISKCEADYVRPLHTGDKVRVTVAPEPLSENSYAIRYEVYRLGTVDKLAARVRTEHVCTSMSKRARAPLPPKLARWAAAG
jgi:1,4-dihydroxy-2-naphthoyl-CoA hydrolase